MDYINSDDKYEVGKIPFYGSAAFILLVLFVFAAFTIQDQGTLGHWEIACCLLGSGLIAILLFLPHFLQSQLDIVNELNGQADSELASKAFFELKEVRSDLDALAVKIDKVPTLVNKIVSEFLSAESPPPSDEIREHLVELKHEIILKLESIEQSNLAPPFLQESDQGVERLQESIDKITTDLTHILNKVQTLEESVTSLPVTDKIEETTDASEKDTNPMDEEQVEEVISGIVEQAKELPIPEEPKAEGEEYLDAEEDSSEEIIDEPEKESTAPDPLDIDDEPLLEIKDATSPQILLEEEKKYPPESGDEEVMSSENAENLTSDELDLGLPDPAETLRKVDALLAGEDTQASIEKKDSTSEKTEKNGTTTVVANVMIGIGNKPFLRGDGPGLSWDEGVSMNFVEIGKWAWSPPRKNASLTVQVYRNDQDPDKGGKVEVRPGQKLEITPDFS